MSHRRTNSERFHIHKLSKIVKLTEAEGRMVVSRDWRGANGGICFLNILFIYS